MGECGCIDEGAQMEGHHKDFSFHSEKIEGL